MYLRLPECDAIPEVENGNAVVPFVEGPILSGTIIQYTCDTGVQHHDDGISHLSLH